MTGNKEYVIGNISYVARKCSYDFLCDMASYVTWNLIWDEICKSYVTIWKSILTTRSPITSCVWNIRAHVNSRFCNLSFRQDRPQTSHITYQCAHNYNLCWKSFSSKSVPEMSFQILGRRWGYLFFIIISYHQDRPQHVRMNTRAHVMSLFPNFPFSLRSSPNVCVDEIQSLSTRKVRVDKNSKLGFAKRLCR